MSDRAAALTYYAALSIFPGAIVLVSLLKLVGSADTVDQLLDGVEAITAGGASDTLQASINDLVRDRQGAGIALLIGLAAALWSASAYVGGLLRAHAAITGVDSELPWWKERGLQLGLTAAMILAMGLALVAILASGPVAEGVGAAVGAEEVAVDLWSILKWPALLLVGIAIAGLIRMAAARNWRVRGLVSWGGLVGAAVWLTASGGFALYVAHFGKFDQTYRSLTAVIIFLVWLWLSNAALLFGAELDAEIDSHPTPRKD